MRAASTIVLILFLIGCAAGGRAPASEPSHSTPDVSQQTPDESDAAFELSQTQKHLGVPVREFPPPQGLTGLDDLPADAPQFKFTVTERRPTGPEPPASYTPKRSVQVRAPDGSVYEAYVGHDDPQQIVPGHGHVSTPANTRQRYGTHHGYAYHPNDVFVGQREGGRLRTKLFFRDVGSHTTGPHTLAIDSKGNVHLAVADVNIYQDNRLDLYWVIGNPATGKWEAAWRIDLRGFTSWSHPWSAAWGDKVHLLWNWCDVSVNKTAPGMGAFHLEWSPNGFGRKVRVVKGEVREWGLAIDPQSGRLLIALSRDDGVYVLSKPEGGSWTRPARLHPRIRRRHNIAVEPAEGGAFVIRLAYLDTREFVLRPR
ncbi:MAG TPA: hypothetical protein VFZ44_03585 [Pyrinomonadaceae bacterium]